MPVEGTPAFNAVALLEIDALNFTSTDSALVGHGAYINTKTGATYGSFSCHRWSKETIEQLKVLKTLMEKDLAALVFVSETASPLDTETGISLPVEPGGIGEYASRSEAEPI